MQTAEESSFAALVLGLDSHGLAAVRALSRAGVCSYALEKDASLPGVRSRHPRQVFYTPSYDAEHLLPALARVRQALAQHPRVALLAMNDRQVEVIAQHRDTVGALYGVVWTAQAHTVLRLQRKSELEAHCRAQGLNYPRTVLFNGAADATLAEDFRFPVIIKPVRPLSSFKTQMAADVNSLRRRLAQYGADMPILGQEYIAGGDEAIYFGALQLDQGRVLHAMAGRKLASHPPGRGQTTVAETVDAPEVLRLTERFFAGCGLSGPVSLEVKRAPDGSFWVIEPTVGRTDFWAGLCIHAGFNQPLMEYQQATGQFVSPAADLMPAVWYDSERDPVAYPRLAWQNRSLWPRQMGQCFCYLAGDDLTPFLHAVRRRLMAALNRRPL
jgi:predicted ATP-grasp superfamily ATP-dependent carboligase